MDGIGGLSQTTEHFTRQLKRTLPTGPWHCSLLFGPPLQTGGPMVADTRRLGKDAGSCPRPGKESVPWRQRLMTSFVGTSGTSEYSTTWAEHQMQNKEKTGIGGTD